MLIRPEDATNIALGRLGRGAEWEQIEKWLKESREACVQQSLNDEPAKSRKAQGALQVIDELLKMTKAAVDLTARR